MSWFSKIFAKRQTAPYLPEIQIEPFAYTGGVSVTPDRARTYSAVYRATALISQTIGWLPWSVLRDMRLNSISAYPLPQISASRTKVSLKHMALISLQGLECKR